MSDYQIPKCEIIPLPGHQMSFRIDGNEVTRWHYGKEYPRPFFYPLLGPSGETLTRMGHPGASNHDHHRSVWFAHHKLLGIDFWSENTDARIEQTMWYVINDGDTASYACELGWFDGHDPQPLVRQELIVTLTPLDSKKEGQPEYTLDLQSTFRPTADQIEYQQSNFGFFAVRVAKSMTEHFGGGRLTGDSGATGEPDLFGKPNAWMDYSGPVVLNDESERKTAWEGITYFDHPQNPTYPAKWHVRSDGWMGASGCRDEGLITTRMEPLRLRYLLHVHQGEVDTARAETIASEWAQRPMQTVTRSKQPHQQFEIIEA